MSEHVLIADGDSERGKRLAEACAARGLSSTVTSHGAGALEAALAEGPAALVCQLDLPLIDGPRLAAILDANPRTRGLSIVFLDDHPGAARRGAIPGQVIAAPVEPDQVAGAIQALVSRSASQREQVRSDEGGVEGQLTELPLHDLLELFHVSRKTGIVEVTRRIRGGRELGQIVLRGGDVIHAAVAEVEGTKAFFRLLAWERGDFSFRPGPSPAAPSIEGSTRMLLVEGRRQLDEWQRLAVELPPLDAELRLQIERSALPNVIHPLTQEVLLVLELHARVRDVVEHCSYPDYQVLRTLATLLGRGIVEVVTPSGGGAEPEAGSPFHPSRAARLREWLGATRARGLPRQAKLLVASSDTQATRDLTRWLGAVAGVELAPGAAAESFGASDLVTLARASLDEDLSLELIHLPVGDEFAAFWATAGHGALGTLLLLEPPVAPAVERLAPLAAELSGLPRPRLFHVVITDPEQPLAPERLLEELAPLGEAPLSVLLRGREDEAVTRLCELLGSVLP